MESFRSEYWKSWKIAQIQYGLYYILQIHLSILDKGLDWGHSMTPADSIFVSSQTLKGTHIFHDFFHLLSDERQPSTRHRGARTSRLNTFFKPLSRPDKLTDARPITIFSKKMFYSKGWVGRGSSCHSHRSYSNDYFVANQDQAQPRADPASHSFSLPLSISSCMCCGTERSAILFMVFQVHLKKDAVIFHSLCNDNIPIGG